MSEQDRRPIDDTPHLDDIVFRIADAIGAGELPAWRAEAILRQIDAHEWLRDHGYVPQEPAPRMPDVKPPELVAEQQRIAAGWHQLSAQIRAGNPPKADWIGLSEADRQLIDRLYGYRPHTVVEKEAEAC